MSNHDIEAMTDEELMDSWTQLGLEHQASRERIEAFSAEHQKRERKKQLKAMAGDVSEQDLALLQEVHAEGIASEEAVLTGDDVGSLSDVMAGEDDD